MKVHAGLWIDHQRTLIVITFPGGEKKLEVRAQVEALPSGAPRTDPGRLNPFYTEVITAIRDAEAVLIFGPDEARNELRHHLERARLGRKISGVEEAENMTVPELAAKVREHFQVVAGPETPVSIRKSDSPSRARTDSPQSAHSQQEQRS